MPEWRPQAREGPMRPGRVDAVLLLVLWEAALVPVALLAARWLDVQLAGAFRLDPLHLLVALLGTLPLWWLVKLLRRSGAPAVRNLLEWVESQVRELLGGASIAQLAAISLLAGVAEELLFRGVIQVGLQQVAGPWGGLLLASALFGAAHWVSAAYVGFASLMGLYLGLLYWMTGNLLVPVIIHGLYDFLALRLLLAADRG